MVRIDLKALRKPPALVMIVLLAIFGVLIFITSEWRPRPRWIPRDDVWRVVQREAALHELDPRFVFAIVAAESSFNAKARNRDARGLMQVRSATWSTVSDRPFREAWKWEANVAVGTAYLGRLKAFLQEKDQFSYPLLAACYRYGPGRVQEAGFRLQNLPRTRNRVYRELFGGSVAPVAIPGGRE